MKEPFAASGEWLCSTGEFPQLDSLATRLSESKGELPASTEGSFVKCTTPPAILTGACLGVMFLGLNVQAADWPQWGATSCKNMVADEKLPDSFAPGEKDSQTGTIKLETVKNVRWARKVCATTYSTPVVAAGKVFLCGGGDNKEGIIACLEEKTGRLLWCWQGGNSANGFGICSTPLVEGDRLYVVDLNCVAMGLDVNGQADGPDRRKPRVLWAFDMQKQLKSFPADVYCGSCIIDGEMLYAPTSNGIDPFGPGAKQRMFELDKQFKGGRKIRNDESAYRVPSPDAPNLAVFAKSTGRLVATDDAPIAKNLLKGQWSSCAMGCVGGRNLVFYGGGDGFCYAFEALQSMPLQPAKLKTVWSYDCNPAEYKDFGGMPRIVHYYHGDSRWGGTLNKNDGTYAGVAEIIGTPVLYRNRIYVAIGRDAAMGRGRGALQCIDATQTGDISRSGKVWTYQGLDWTPATVSIADGLVYLADMAGRLHCLDAETGHRYWAYDAKCGMVLGSTLVADGKVYMPSSKGLFIFAAGREARLLDKVTFGSPIYSTPVAANGTLYIASHKGWLWAIHN
jgi:outer membrane protein assembly factor BamB